jgi:hypothetical protein
MCFLKTNDREIFVKEIIHDSVKFEDVRGKTLDIKRGE